MALSKEKGKLISGISVACIVFSIFSGCKTDDGSLYYSDWNNVILNYRDSEDSVVYRNLARLNLALAETGQLAEKAFSYCQAGDGGLIPEWGQNPETGALLSDIYFSIGHIALAQRYAFETLVQDEPEYSSRMLSRLIRTNIIYGCYAVAEKYIDLLEKDAGWKGWASGQRRFLYDDKAVETDPLLGMKRKCIPAADFLSEMRGLEEDLKDIVRANPEHRTTMEYLGVLFLLRCDFDSFRGMLDEFYGTPALEFLPASFAEAACMMSELEPDYWKSVGVDVGIYRRYVDFKKRLGCGMSLEKYKKTLWYYVMRVNSL